MYTLYNMYIYYVIYLTLKIGPQTPLLQQQVDVEKQKKYCLITYHVCCWFKCDLLDAKWVSFDDNYYTYTTHNPTNCFAVAYTNNDDVFKHIIIGDVYWIINIFKTLINIMIYYLYIYSHTRTEIGNAANVTWCDII